MSEQSSFHDPSIPAHNPSASPFWSFADVEVRLVEAVRAIGRLPDRERGWLRAGTMSIWRQVQAEWGDYPDPDVAPPRSGLSRREYREMEEAMAWMIHVPAGESRRIVGIAIRQLVFGDESRVQWTRVLAAMPNGRSWTTDGLRKRYARAITMICAALNAAEKRA